MVGTSQHNLKRVIAAITLISIGVLLLLDVGVLWPLFILVPGLILLAAAYAGGRAAAPLAIPGALIGGTGALLFVQNVTGYWQSWAYAWTLYGVFLGLGFVIMGQLLDDGAIEQFGRGFMLFGLLAFAGFAFLFEIVIGIGGGLLGGLAWPWLLIALGVFLLLRNITRGGNRHKRKHRRERLFGGPVVYGSTKRKHYDPSRLSLPDEEDESVREP